MKPSELLEQSNKFRKALKKAVKNGTDSIELEDDVLDLDAEAVCDHMHKMVKDWVKDNPDDPDDEDEDEDEDEDNT